MWLIAGLGNPGRKYSRTRHNIGFMILDEFAKRHNIEFTERKEYRIGRGSVAGDKVLLVEPLLFMNLSGYPVRDILRKSGIAGENLIVVYDDLDMQTGKIRIRKTGSSGGHRGVESIISSIGSKDFIRLKIGIGREPGIPAEDYVLGKFSRDELNTIKDSINIASEAIQVIIDEGVDPAMNRFN